MKTRIYTDMNKTINTDIGNKGNLIYSDLTYKVRGCILTVYNELGYGHKEQVYQKALATEFKLQELSFQREANLTVKYKNSLVGNYRPDFVINDQIILEIKAVPFMAKAYEEQLLHYLKTTGFKLGLLVNFGASRLVIRRLIWTNDQRKSVLNQRKSVLNPCKS